MPKVSINILTKNRKDSLHVAIESVLKQSMQDFEIVVVNDGSTDKTQEKIASYKLQVPNKFQIINHEISRGITLSRMEALKTSQGEYVAVLDDDDAWTDVDKLKKQVEFLDANSDYVLVGGGVEISNIQYRTSIYRPEGDKSIRKWMLLKNPFFTSTVMFRKEAAIKAGGFVKDDIDLGEDYDLWLRLGKLGKMYNFQEVFTKYSKSDYNKEKFHAFLTKQRRLIEKNQDFYPYYWLSKLILNVRNLI